MRYLLLLLAAAISLSACKKESSEQCEELKNALIANNEAAVTRIITSLIPAAGPAPALNDQEGFQGHYNTLVERLTACDVGAKAFCYGCIDTYPSTSEILFTVKSGSQTIQRVIDLGPNAEGTRFVCKRMHD